MQPISSLQLAKLLESTSCPEKLEICKVSTDSRTCGANDVFIAIVGEKFDGHDFVADVMKNGCKLAVVNHLIANVPPENQIVVNDTLEAYGKIGQWNRNNFKGTVIGLTGSSGKTTTKEELRFILSQFGKVYATAGNHNNFIGVPESLCNLDMNADFAIIEMGMSAKGEISRLTSYVMPDVAIITNIYPMHIEFFDSYSGIAEAKSEIFEGLKLNGIAIVNADCDFADLIYEKALQKTSHIVRFGKNHAPKVAFETSSVGEHYLYNAWCVLKTIEAMGLDVNKAAKHIKEFGALDGRGKQHKLRLPDNKGYYTLIDDSYSGQPEAMKLAIKALDKMTTKGRKIVVLGKMAELGDYSKPKHIEIGETVAKSSINIAIGVCPEMKDMLSQLPANIEQHYFENKDKVADFLLNQLLQNEDVVLIKGARYSSKLYQVTDELLQKGKNI